MTKYFYLFVTLILTQNIYSQQIELYTSYLGKYEFTMIGNTMNTVENGSGGPCVILTETSATLSLDPDQTMIAAFLYWAGSGSLTSGDLDIELNGTPITPDRTFSNTMGSGSLPIYGAFKDVTTQVLAAGNGVYTVSEFDLNGVIGPYCGTGGNFGGWSIVIVYQDPNTTDNLVNIYDGFEKVDAFNSLIEIELSNLNVLNLVGNNIGFLSWEGDVGNSSGESLKINGSIVSNPPLNPAANVFNGTNSFTGSNQLYNMDLDVFPINDYTEIGQNTMDIELTSAQDAVVVNNIVVVLNSQVPDATITGDAVPTACDERDISVDYTVFNTIATNPLPAGTPIAFYADTTLVGTSATVNEIPIGGSEDGTILLTIPVTVPTQFTLIGYVDDDGTGTSSVIEFDETNNTFEIPVTLGVTPTVNTHDETLTKCDTDDNQSEPFDLTTVGAQMTGTQTGVLVRYYADENDANIGNANNIATPTAYSNISNPQTIWVRMEDVTGCSIVDSFQLEIMAAEALNHEIPDMVRCSSQEILTGVAFDLSENETAILNGDDPLTHTVSYHHTENDAKSGANAIVNFNNYPNTASPETIWARVNNADGCVKFGSFEISTTAPEAMTYEIPNLEDCSPSHILTGIPFDLSQNESAILNGNNPADFTITYHLSMEDAVNGIAAIPNFTNYPNTSSPQTIWARMIGLDGCVLYGSFQIIAIAAGELTYAIPPIETCSPDQILTGIPTDLTLNEEEILNGNDPDQFTLTYHLDENGAINGTGAIADPENYSNISAPQTIWVRMVSLQGCVQYGSFVLEYLPAPVAQSALIEECSMVGPATFFLPDANEEIVANTSGLDFTYYLTQNEAENETNPLPETYTPPTQTAQVFVRIEDEFGCFTVVQLELETVINTTTIAEPYGECDNPYELNDGFTEFNLTNINDQVNLQLGLIGSIISYHQTAEDAATGTNPIANPENYTNTTSPQTIFARALDANGNCGGVAEFSIEVLSVPEFELPEYLAFCNYDEKTYEFLDPFVTYTWLDAEENVISTQGLVEFDQEGIYTLEVIGTENECPARREIEIIFDNQPTILDVDVNEHTVTISATGGIPPYQYSLNNGLTWSDDYVMHNVQGGIYDLIVKSKYGCISTSKTFGVLGIPNLITPNGDGKNDYLEIRGLEMYLDAHIKIFDRYGKIFVDRPLTTGFRWDGKYKGDPVPSGDYWYIITVEEGKTITGHIAVRNRFLKDNI